jgi:hypothetical protein
VLKHKKETMIKDNRTEIEEIVQDVDKAIRANFAWDVLAGGYIVSSADNIAQELYYKGYRKSTDLAEEIFAEIEKCSEVALMNGHIETPILCIGFGVLAELKKKYIGEDTKWQKKK